MRLDCPTGFALRCALFTKWTSNHVPVEDVHVRCRQHTKNCFSIHFLVGTHWSSVHHLVYIVITICLSMTCLMIFMTFMGRPSLLSLFCDSSRIVVINNCITIIAQACTIPYHTLPCMYGVTPNIPYMYHTIIIWFYTIAYHMTLYHTTLCHTIPCWAMPYSTTCAIS